MFYLMLNLNFCHTASLYGWLQSENPLYISLISFAITLLASLFPRQMSTLMLMHYIYGTFQLLIRIKWSVWSIKEVCLALLVVYPFVDPFDTSQMEMHACGCVRELVTKCSHILCKCICYCNLFINIFLQTFLIGKFQIKNNIIIFVIL